MAACKGIKIKHFVVILILLRTGSVGFWEPTRETVSWT
jgi:hypothetical protein